MRRLVVLLALVLPALAQPPARPHITGISHVAYFVTDMPRSLAFWHDLLGFELSYNRTAPNSTDTTVAFLKLNDQQYVELLSAPPTNPKDFMSHLCFLTDDVEQMRLYLAAQGVAVPARTSHTRTGDLVFQISDPDGTQIEFSQPQPASVEAQGAGKFLPATRISQHIYHVGFLVADAQRSIDFYTRILGFHETWRGASSPSQLSWINMQVPDSDAPPGNADYIEFMLYRTLPATFGNSNHVALEVPSIANAVSALQSRPAFAAYGKTLTPHTGVNGKRQLNLFDPDGTRVELMEPTTADGKPVPSSTAPPPVTTSGPRNEPSRTLEKVGGAVQAPVTLHSVEQIFPAHVDWSRFPHYAMVNLVVETDGTPSSIQIVRSYVQDAMSEEDHKTALQMDQALIDCVSQYRFKPAMKDGQSVAVAINIEVNIDPF